jgi:hypothetical protein
VKDATVPVYAERMLDQLARGTMMQRWEYKVVAVDANEGQGMFNLGGAIRPEPVSQLLSELGNEGWDLVTAFDTNMGHGSSRNYVFVLKRPKTG